MMGSHLLAKSPIQVEVPSLEPEPDLILLSALLPPLLDYLQGYLQGYLQCYILLFSTYPASENDH